MIIFSSQPKLGDWGGGRLGRKGGGRCTGGGRRGGRKWDSQVGRKREKKGEIMQHYSAIFCNRKTAKRNRAGTSITGYGKQEV